MSPRGGPRLPKKEQTRSTPGRRPGAQPSTQILEPRTPAVRGSDIERRSINPNTGHTEHHLAIKHPNGTTPRDRTVDPAP
jgi:hypothetical protein